jgi:hypothetical protein
MIENLLYTALATLLVIVILHIGVFWVSRVIQPPKPRVVYMQSPPPQYNTLPAPAPLLQQPPPPPAAPPAPEIKLPTYDSPPPAAAPAAKPMLPSLPPPIETRDASRSPPPAS